MEPQREDYARPAEASSIQFAGQFSLLFGMATSLATGPVEAAVRTKQVVLHASVIGCNKGVVRALLTLRKGDAIVKPPRTLCR